MLIFLLAVGPLARVFAGAATAVVLLFLWAVVPLAARRTRRSG
ncbi:MAG TPA: hypothetical protein VLR26_11690 [Frankiaceae bacterium]|nr:hypothetical protein [Frankiaceae bacterium]